MFNVFKFKRMNSEIDLFVPSHLGDDHQPGPEESVGAFSAESLGVTNWMEENKDSVHRFVSAIDDAANWITSDKMFVMFANVGLDEFDSIEEMDTTQSFCYHQQLWPGHPLWKVLGSKPSELTLADITELSLSGVEQHKTQQCFAVVELSSQHEFSGKYVCVLTAVGEGDFEEEVFQVSFLFLKLANYSPKYVCSYRAEMYHDQAEVLRLLWELYPKYNLNSLIVTQVMEYQFPTLEPLVQITSDTVPPSAILEVLQSIPDGHVMVDTLRPVPLSENSLKRDYGRE